ncbi:MAG: hypothetical protein KKC39_07395 [Candidatus Omnitrophica bacterium]|nr:hypothetical protein [Candidatus Omnitrophota bacterium]MBU4468543.1 hypothetical protein [Candidatus Omnitrophota bacterium]MCG2707758.1 hypothetical protein [Candidatus Omnitrophota bacterium]
MLTEEEKKEMLEDGRSKTRRDNFRSCSREKNTGNISFDNYLLFLDNIQKIFSPFKMSHRVTSTKINKL